MFLIKGLEPAGPTSPTASSLPAPAPRQPRWVDLGGMPGSPPSRSIAAKTLPGKPHRCPSATPSPPVPLCQASPSQNTGGRGRQGARSAATRSRRREGAAVIETPAPAGHRPRCLLWLLAQLSLAAGGETNAIGALTGRAWARLCRRHGENTQSLFTVNAPHRRRHVYTKGTRQKGTGAITDTAPAVSSTASRS